MLRKKTKLVTDNKNNEEIDHTNSDEHLRRFPETHEVKSYFGIEKPAKPEPIVTKDIKKLGAKIIVSKSRTSIIRGIRTKEDLLSNTCAKSETKNQLQSVPKTNTDSEITNITSCSSTHAQKRYTPTSYESPSLSINTPNTPVITQINNQNNNFNIINTNETAHAQTSQASKITHLVNDINNYNINKKLNNNDINSVNISRNMTPKMIHDNADRACADNNRNITPTMIINNDNINKNNIDYNNKSITPDNFDHINNINRACADNIRNITPDMKFNNNDINNLNFNNKSNTANGYDNLNNINRDCAESNSRNITPDIISDTNDINRACADANLRNITPDYTTNINSDKLNKNVNINSRSITPNNFDKTCADQNRNITPNINKTCANDDLRNKTPDYTNNINLNKNDSINLSSKYSSNLSSNKSSIAQTHKKSSNLDSKHLNTDETINKTLINISNSIAHTPNEQNSETSSNIVKLTPDAQSQIEYNILNEHAQINNIEFKIPETKLNENNRSFLQHDSKQSDNLKTIIKRAQSHPTTTETQINDNEYISEMTNNIVFNDDNKLSNSKIHDRACSKSLSENLLIESMSKRSRSSSLESQTFDNDEQEYKQKYNKYLKREINISQSSESQTTTKTNLQTCAENKIEKISLNISKTTKSTAQSQNNITPQFANNNRITNININDKYNESFKDKFNDRNYDSMSRDGEPNFKDSNERTCADDNLINDRNRMKQENNDQKTKDNNYENLVENLQQLEINNQNNNKNLQQNDKNNINSSEQNYIYNINQNNQNNLYTEQNNAQNPNNNPQQIYPTYPKNSEYPFYNQYNVSDPYSLNHAQIPYAQPYYGSGFVPYQYFNHYIPPPLYTHPVVRFSSMYPQPPTAYDPNNPTPHEPHIYPPPALNNYQDFRKPPDPAMAAYAQWQLDYSRWYQTFIESKRQVSITKRTSIDSTRSVHGGSLNFENYPRVEKDNLSLYGDYLLKNEENTQKNDQSRAFLDIDSGKYLTNIQNNNIYENSSRDINYDLIHKNNNLVKKDSFLSETKPEDSRIENARRSTPLLHTNEHIFSSISHSFLNIVSKNKIFLYSIDLFDTDPDFPGPLAKTETTTRKLSKYMQKRIDENSIEISPLKLLWKILLHVVKSRGKVDYGELAEILLDFNNNLTITSHLNYSEINTSEETHSQLVLSLLNNDVKLTHEHLLGINNWGLLFAMSLNDENSRKDILIKYIESLDHHDLLRSYISLKNNIPIDISLLKDFELVKNWNQHVALFLSQFNTHSEACRMYVYNISKILQSKGRWNEYQVCLIILDLVMGQENVEIPTFYPEVGLSRQSLELSKNDILLLRTLEIYEYLKLFKNPAFNYPYAQIFKFSLAEMLAFNKNKSQCFEYLQSISNVVLLDPSSYSHSFLYKLVKLSKSVFYECFNSIKFPDWLIKLDFYLNNYFDNTKSKENSADTLMAEIVKPVFTSDDTAGKVGENVFEPPQDNNYQSNTGFTSGNTFTSNIPFSPNTDFTSNKAFTSNNDFSSNVYSNTVFSPGNTYSPVKIDSSSNIIEQSSEIKQEIYSQTNLGLGIHSDKRDDFKEIEESEEIIPVPFHNVQMPTRPQIPLAPPSFPIPSLNSDVKMPPKIDNSNLPGFSTPYCNPSDKFFSNPVEIKPNNFSQNSIKDINKSSDKSTVENKESSPSSKSLIKGASSLLGKIFKPKEQIFLPDDKEQQIVFDSTLNRYVDKSNPEGDKNLQASAPPISIQAIDSKNQPKQAITNRPINRYVSPKY